MINKAITQGSRSVNSLVSLNRRYDLDLFLKKNLPDIIAISETKLNKKHNLMFDGYQIFRSKRADGGGGGTALLVKKNIICSQIKLSKKYKILECTVTKIKLKANKFLFIISAYASPSIQSKKI